MDFYDYLLNSFGVNEPIFTNEIVYEKYSKPWISKTLAELCNEKKLIRFDKGIYYIPKTTLLGVSKLNPRKVIEKKYIVNGNNRNGYYSGSSFLNQIGLSTQVPNTIEIFTNDEPAKVREVMVGTIKVILRKARVDINKENAEVLSFLELMNYVAPSFFDEERKEITIDYIRKYGITRKDVSRYASAFPDRAMRTLIESEVIYSVTQ